MRLSSFWAQLWLAVQLRIGCLLLAGVVPFMVFKTARGIVVEGGSSDRDALGIMIHEAETATEILGLPSDASGGEVRAAYIRLAKEYHPDTHPGDLAAERRFQRISKAYNDLRSPYH